MKASLIVTVFNEEESIIALLDSIWEQSVQPDNVVIIDAGSVDETVELIKKWRVKHNKVKLRLLIRPDLNRSAGRNVGIKASSSEINVFTDGGCVAEKEWFERIVKPFADKEIETVAGFYTPVFENIWGEVFSWFTSVLQDDLNEKIFLPSARSLAVRKKVLEQVGMFPENLSTCEDLVVAEILKERGTMVVATEARVGWMQEVDIYGFFRQISGYANGDVRAGYTQHVRKIWLVYARYGIFLLLPPLFLIYLLFPVIKFKKRIRTFSILWRVVVVQMVADVAVMWGGLMGYMSR